MEKYTHLEYNELWMMSVLSISNIFELNMYL